MIVGWTKSNVRVTSIRVVPGDILVRVGMAIDCKGCFATVAVIGALSSRNSNRSLQRRRSRLSIREFAGATTIATATAYYGLARFVSPRVRFHSSIVLVEHKFLLLLRLIFTFCALLDSSRFHCNFRKFTRACVLLARRRREW